MTTTTVQGIEVLTEGQGAETIVCIHGWPDTYRLWDRTVQALQGRYRCVRFTLPGFEGPPPQGQKALTLAELTARLLRSPTPQASIHWYKNYPYVMTWLRQGGGLGGLAPFAPHCPMLYVYGERQTRQPRRGVADRALGDAGAAGGVCGGVAGVVGDVEDAHLRFTTAMFLIAA